MPRHIAGSWRQVRRQSLEGLLVGQFVGADRALTRLRSFDRRSVHSAHVSDLGVAVGVGGRGEPRAHSVRLQVGRF
jgi:hypothetical protein